MKLRTLIIVGAILSIVIGYTVGKVADASAPEPGSSDDPLVAKSYVDKALQDRITDLEKAVAELTVTAQALQSTVNELQAKINPSSGSSSTRQGSGSSSSSSGSTAPQPDASYIGKVAYVREANNYVNLRRGPSTSEEVIKQVQKGEPMGITEVRNSWFKVRLSDDTTGWVASWVVEVK